MLSLLAAFFAAAAHAQAADGTLVSWGWNVSLQVSGTPAGTFTAVAAGGFHGVGIKTDGTLVSWGGSFHNQVSPAGAFSAVAAGGFHSVGIKTDGTLVSWGSDRAGQVSGTPDGTFTAVDAGSDHSVAIKTDGTLVSWGDNDYGQVSGTPSGTFLAVAAGGLYSVGIKTDGTLVSWGNNSFGQVSFTPAGTFSAVAAGDSHSVGIRTDGTLVSWGWNGYNQVSGTPAGTFLAVAAGAYHSVGIKTDGTIVSWGDNGFGQVSGTPAGTFSAVAAGWFHSVGIVSQINSAPVAQCHDVTVSADGNCSASASIDNGSYDPDGDTITLSQSPAGPYSLGETLVTLTVTDSNGESTQCQASVTVVDDTPPQITCPGTITQNTDPGACTASVTFAAQASDSCSATIAYDIGGTPIPSTYTFPLGQTTVRAVATDSSGNSTDCSFDVMVTDNQPPTIVSCPADFTVITTSASGMAVNYPAASASDNCSTPTITYSQASGSSFNLGTTPVTVTATDASGNSAQCTFNVNVVYSESGFLQPINADGSSVFKLGTTVQVRFQLTEASAGIADAVAKFGYVKVSSTVSGAVNVATAGAKPTTGDLFSYDPKTDEYYFNWGTKGLTSGTYLLQIKLGDGVSRTVKAGLK